MNRLLSFFIVLGAVRPLIGAPGAGAAFDRRTVVSSVADRVEELYVDPKIGAALAEHLRRRLAEGAFQSCATPTALADALTRVLREVADDIHLSVRVGGPDSGGPRIRIGPGPGPGPGMEPGRPGERRIVVGPGPGEGPGDGGGGGGHKDPAVSGVAKVERLEGNVGYVAISGFPPGARNREAFAAAMNLLEDTDAMIVDVGQCPGGAPGAVAFLASYFFGPEPVELLSRYDRPSGRTERDFTMKDLPGKRRPDVPLWIIAGPDSASACESFAYTLQKYGRASVVGAKTAGAGYNNVLLPVGDGFSLSVSVGRPMHPKTGGGWEGTGVIPDVAAPAGRALATAHREALNALLAKASPSRPALAWALEASKARESGLAPASAVPLAAYAGSYGARDVFVADSQLFYKGPTGRVAGPLLPVARDAFLFSDQIRIQFERGADGAVVALWLERPDGNRERFDKGLSAAAAASPCTFEKGK